MLECEFGQSNIMFEKDLNESSKKNKRKNQGKGKEILRPASSVEIDLIEKFSNSMPVEFSKTKDRNKCLDCKMNYQGKGKQILGSTITKLSYNEISTIRVNRESVRDGDIPFHVELSTDSEEIERNPIGLIKCTEIGNSRNTNAKNKK